MFFSWGCGHDGRLGTGNESNACQPVPVDLISRAIYKVKPSTTQPQRNNARNNSNATSAAVAASSPPPPAAAARRNAFGIVINDEESQQQSQQHNQQQQQSDEAEQTSLPQNDSRRLKPNRIFSGGFHNFVEFILADETHNEDQCQQQQQQQQQDEENKYNALLVAFGSNEFGQLGVGDQTVHTSPQCVEPFFFSHHNQNDNDDEDETENEFSIFERSVVFIHREDEEDFLARRRRDAAQSSSSDAANSNSNNAVTSDRRADELEWAAASAAASRTTNVAERTRDLLSERMTSTENSNQMGKRHQLPKIDERPFLWYRHQDLVDIRCGRDHAVAWFRKKLFVCGRNDSGQLGLGDESHRSKFRELKIVSSSSSSSSSLSSSAERLAQRVLDVSCGAFHTLLVLGPAPVSALAVAAQSSSSSSFSSSFSSSTSSCSSAVNGRIFSSTRASTFPWLEEQLEFVLNQLKNEHPQHEADHQPDEQQRRSQFQLALSTLAEQFVVLACGRGDSGELGCDGDDTDEQLAQQERVKAALDRRQHRQNFAASSSDVPGGAAGGSRDSAVRAGLTATSTSASSANAVEADDEDPAIAAVLDPSYSHRSGNWQPSMMKQHRNTNQHQHQQQHSSSSQAGGGAASRSTTRENQKRFRVDLHRSVWTRVDLSAGRCCFVESNIDNSDNSDNNHLVVIVPLRVVASRFRSSVLCARVSVSSSSSSSSLSSPVLNWFTFGCAYDGKRETMETSIPTEVIIAGSDDTENSFNSRSSCVVENIFGIEDAEIAWTTDDEILIRCENEETLRSLPFARQIQQQQQQQETTAAASVWHKLTLWKQSPAVGNSTSTSSSSSASATDISSCRLLYVIPQVRGLLIVCEGKQNQQQQQSFARNLFVFGLGDNYFGQLGLGDEWNRYCVIMSEKNQPEEEENINSSSNNNNQRENDSDDDDDGALEGLGALQMNVIREGSRTAPVLVSISVGCHHAALVISK